MSSAVLDALLIHKSLDRAFDILRSTLETVAAQTAPLEWFIMSKSLKSTYASENQPHVQAWKRMAARGETVPEVGSRMAYVIVSRPNAKALYERTEHPDYVVAAKLHYCAKYYLENAQDVIERLLGPTGLGERVKDMFAGAIARSEQKSAGTMSLLKFKKTRLT
jgi:DNA polymerase elongation subunit (family B)